MRKIFFLFLILAMIVLVGCSQASDFQGSVAGKNIEGDGADICPCGCNENLEACGCPTAEAILKERS